MNQFLPYGLEVELTRPHNSSVVFNQKINNHAAMVKLRGVDVVKKITLNILKT